MAYSRYLLIIIIICLAPVRADGQNVEPKPLASLQSYTGIWHMPNARVLPDWHIRIKYGYDDPWRYYGGALGLWDRLEFHGQFTEISSLDALSVGYGYYKDRSVGARLVLVRENDFLPQLSVGTFDATGTAKLGMRYLTVSKMFGPVDITVGLGQGILSGEYVPESPEARRGSDRASSFLLSTPFRKTKPFAGIEYHITPDLTFSAEYSSIDYSNMFGMRGTTDRKVSEKRDLPVNLGLKYQLTPKIHTQLGLMGGDAVAAGISLELPLKPEGMLTWQKVKVQAPGERERWEAYAAANDELAELLGERIRVEGFAGIMIRISHEAAWIEANNTVHLSDARAMGRIALVADNLLPERISILYLNLKEYGMVVQSLRTTRADLRAFQQSRTDKDNYLFYSNLEMYGNDNWQEFISGGKEVKTARIRDKRFSIEISPRIRSVINDPSGFFTTKGVLETKANYRLWPGGVLTGQFDLTLFNEWGDDLNEPLEPDSTRTDIVLYEKESVPRLSVLALDQHVNLPWSIMGRASAGIFESAYAGFGAEVFRYFKDGLLGIGLEGQAVRKRDTKDNFSLRDDVDHWYRTAFLNLYAQVWPSQGIEAGLKIGRFLGGDPGVRFELRRSFKYFTIGGWYTVTDTDNFKSRFNREHREKGVYIRFPIALFRDTDSVGHLGYSMTEWTRDAGQTVRQPSSLYPMDPWSTPDHTRRNLEDMRIQR